jgi:ribosomal protein L11 methyltransferase
VGDFSSPQGGIRGGLIIHDGRHLPDLTLLNTSLSIEIDAHLAFGTGTHETTRLMCRRLMELDLNGKRVLDCGCGTGILAIAALKLGAATALAYDIDEWSVDNTRHNAVINQVDNRLEAAHGDATLLYNMQPESFQVVMANINRNILMADMPQFVRMMTPDGRLLLSGFYREDVPLLAEKAAELGLTVTDVSEDNGWACMMLKNYKFQS